MAAAKRTHLLTPYRPGVAYTGRYIVAETDRSAAEVARRWLATGSWVVTPETIRVFGRDKRDRFLREITTRSIEQAEETSND